MSGKGVFSLSGTIKHDASDEVSLLRETLLERIRVLSSVNVVLESVGETDGVGILL